MGSAKVTSRLTASHSIVFKPRRRSWLVPPGPGLMLTQRNIGHKAHKVLSPLFLLSPPTLPALLRSPFRIANGTGADIADGPTPSCKFLCYFLLQLTTPPLPVPLFSSWAELNRQSWKIKMRDFMRENHLKMKCPEMFWRIIVMMQEGTL